ncbi:Na+/H+ antiporter subunit D [candidate division WOR-3 bacterium]|uniref:Na+/H+ antiporter subunit D n=1 Tax=candidate division WOR-3 bacterium TaxID=2052148 RepID=A0A937XI91_UNCW3|nr:Na+/H+ antiporter subunit D [candidate division WOR-3 bacterium]
MGRRIGYFVFGFAVWMLLVYTLHYQEVIVGIGVALLAAVLFGRNLPVEPSRLLNPVRWFWLLAYIPVFAYMCLKCNIDVALRVLSPGLQLKPGIVRIRTSLKSDIARVFLANSITLTPGTMTVELKEDVLYIHWIEVGSTDPVEAGRTIIGPFEYFLSRIFD